MVGDKAVLISNPYENYQKFTNSTTMKNTMQIIIPITLLNKLWKILFLSWKGINDNM